MYLGFNYDLARGMQEELLRWADQQRKVKKARVAQRRDDLLSRSESGPARPVSQERVAERRAS